MDEHREERLTILDFDTNSKAHLCLSYRLMVWLVLGLGSTISFITISSQPAVFACRRLGPHRPKDVEAKCVESYQNGEKLKDFPLQQSMDDGTRREPMEGRHWNRSGFTLKAASLETKMSSAVGENVTRTGCMTKHRCSRWTSHWPLSQTWTKESEGWVLAAISMGYYFVQFPAASVTVCVGSRPICLVATFFCVLTSLSVPAMHFGPLASALVCLVRGASAGALYPAVVSLAATWSGTRETSLVVAIVESGLQVGHAASFLAATVFCDGRDGWADVFYSHAIASAIFGMVFWLVVEERPSENTKCLFISTTERSFLTCSMREKGVTSGKGKVPYRSILTSMPVLAIVVAQLGCEWLDCLMLASLPEFLGIRHGMNEKLVELLISAGFLLSIPVAVVGAMVADRLLDTSVASAATVRKTFDAISKGVPALCFLVLSYLDPSQVTLVAVVYVVTSCSFGLTDSAWPANCLDLAPAYAGVLVSVGEWTGSLMWPVCILTVAYITPEDTVQQWQTVMYITAGLMCVCILFYALFASGEKQKWAEEDNSDTDSIDD